MGSKENNIIKLALYGDSLACPRQGIVNSNERYLALVEGYLRKNFSECFIEVRDKSIGGATIQTLFNQYAQDNTYYSLPGDILIIHSGIVDCAPRPVNEETKRKIGNLPEFLKKRVISYLHNNRAKLLNKSGGYVKTEFQSFNKMLGDFIQHAASSYEKVFVINICPTTVEMEQHSPGFTSNIKRYNDCIKLLTQKKNNVTLINTYDYIMENYTCIEKYIVKEDGHHIHPSTHQWIANQIISHLT